MQKKLCIILILSILIFMSAGCGKAALKSDPVPSPPPPAETAAPEVSSVSPAVSEAEATAPGLTDCRERVRAYYDNGKAIAGNLTGITGYKEHYNVDNGHIAKVVEKSAQAAGVLTPFFTASSFPDVYSPDVDLLLMSVAAYYHDTGMDGNIPADEFEAGKAVFLSGIRGAAAVERQMSRGSSSRADAETKAYDNYFRSDHAVQSGIHVLRDRDFVESFGINADEAAFICLMHSKSTSGVKNLFEKEQFSAAADILSTAAEDFNRAHPEEQIFFDASFLNDDGALARVRAESILIRIADACGHDSKSRTTQSGLSLVFDINEWDSVSAGLTEEALDAVRNADYAQFSYEVADISFYVGDKPLNSGSHGESYVRAYGMGEGNFKSLDLVDNDGVPTLLICLESPDAFPLCTQMCITERILELYTAKLISDDELNSGTFTGDPTIGIRVLVDIAGADELTEESYSHWCEKILDSYGITAALKT